jgi:hypothetical protein
MEIKNDQVEEIAKCLETPRTRHPHPLNKGIGGFLFSGTPYSKISYEPCPREAFSGLGRRRVN